MVGCQLSTALTWTNIFCCPVMGGYNYCKNGAGNWIDIVKYQLEYKRNVPITFYNKWPLHAKIWNYSLGQANLEKNYFQEEPHNVFDTINVQKKKNIEQRNKLTVSKSSDWLTNNINSSKSSLLFSRLLAKFTRLTIF